MLDPSTLERLRQLQESVGEGQNVLLDLLGIFTGDAQRYVREASEALASHDLEAARRHLHALKGAALSVGATRVAELCAALERGAEPELRAAPERLRAPIEEALAALTAAAGGG